MTDIVKQSLTPSELIQQAITSNAGVEQLEKLMELQIKWETREAEKAFRAAMTEFQSKKPSLKKKDSAKFTTKAGAKIEYSYNAIGNIQKMIDPVLSECGLSYRWEQSQEKDKIKITCIVSHVDGHSERTFIEAPADEGQLKNKIQAIGSTITYLKRYTLEGAFGLASGDDDDGAKGKKEEPKPGVTAGEKQEKKTLDDWHKEYMVLFNEYQLVVGVDKARKYDPDNWNERTEGHYKLAIKNLKDALKK